MTTYFDSSAIVALYVTEPFSPRARREARGAGQIPFTPLHDLEVRNALHVIHGRKLITASQLRSLTGHLDDDLQANRLMDARVDLFRVFERARTLSPTYSARLLCRSLDILHVASALDLECTRFVSGDDRQLTLADAVGMGIVDIKTSTRRRRPHGT